MLVSMRQKLRETERDRESRGSANKSSSSSDLSGKSTNKKEIIVLLVSTLRRSLFILSRMFDKIFKIKPDCLWLCVVVHEALEKPFDGHSSTTIKRRQQKLLFRQFFLFC